jgi:hypothetical protein
MSDRREAGIFCSNNKSVFFFLRTWLIYFTLSKPVFCGYEAVRLGAGGYKEMSSFLADNSALVYEHKCGGKGGSCGVSANEYLQLYTGAQINFGDLTPY